VEFKLDRPIALAGVDRVANSTGQKGQQEKAKPSSDARAPGARRLAVGLLQGCGARSRIIPWRAPPSPRFNQSPCPVVVGRRRPLARLPDR
jgi:hypothetical protein